MRDQGAGVTCRCDSAHGSRVLTTHSHGTALKVFLSKLILIYLF